MKPKSDVDPETGAMDPDSTEAHACTVAEVEVDTETGEVTVLSIRSAYEVGPPGQPGPRPGPDRGRRLDGHVPRPVRDDRAVLPGARSRPKDFSEYLMPGPLEMPEIECVVLEIPSSNGPYGVKGVGEMTANSPIPAIVNAIYHATGVRIDELPVTPEKILRGLDARPAATVAEPPSREIPMGQITTWDEFPTVEYVPGVFRQTVSGEKTMLTRIVYRGGVVIPDHSHQAEQLMLVEQGRLWAKVGDEESEVGPGSLLVIPSNWVHAFRQLADEDVVFYECFAPIRLEYLIGFKGPDASLAMIRKGLEEAP